MGKPQNGKHSAAGSAKGGSSGAGSKGKGKGKGKIGTKFSTTKPQPKPKVVKDNNKANGAKPTDKKAEYKKPEHKKTSENKRPTQEDAEADEGPLGSRGQQQKKQRTERQLTEPTGELKIAARKLWEQLRRGDLEADDRKKKMVEMMDLVRGQIKDITFKHDMSRIVQTCLKYGSDAQRDEIAAELEDAYTELSRSLYGRHILMRILKYSSRFRSAVIRAFYGNVRKLVKHKDAAAVLEECYAVYANAGQRWQLVAEFYGNEFAVFKDTDDVRSVDDILTKAPQKKDTVVNALKTAIVPLLQKGTVQHSIVHRALLDYLRFADAAGRQEMIETMRELVVEVLHTREGAHAAMLCLLHGTAKDRKLIAKSLKPYLQRIACEEHGHAVLIGMLDCMDDTVYLGKSLLPDLCALAPELLADQYGRRVLLYVLAGRNSHYVGLDAMHVLRDGDAVRAETSKKDPTTRRRELTAYVSAPLLRWLANNAELAIFDPMPSQAVSETLMRAQGDKQMAWDSVLDLVGRSIEENGSKHVLLNAISNRVITNCIMAEYAPPKSADATLPALPEDNPKFGSDVLSILENSAQLVPAACAGAFPVRALLESPVTGERARKLLRPHVAAVRKAAKAAEKPRVLEAILAKLE
ncbi:armadillo-type protein [Kickxella alabastrina]|uniref:armadillo-type protein n=1 Tax=Kickxella alabastrina TaxID=61397 RepID=UPI00221FE8F1|nr:armadillo-type protein [Kickxella alabastrina]KAI7820744.1 armadillo-type protein [Kickxella alabastrina]